MATEDELRRRRSELDQQQQRLAAEQHTLDAELSQLERERQSRSTPRTTAWLTVPRVLTPLIVLTLFGVVVLLYFQTQKPPEKVAVVVENIIDARVDGWTDTFIDVVAPMTIVAGGTVSGSGPDGVIPQMPNDVWRASRDPWLRDQPFLHAVPDFPVYSLMGKMAQGKPFFVGTRALIQESGRLLLQVNSHYWDRNTMTRNFNPGEGQFTFKLIPPDPRSRITFISAKDRWQLTTFRSGDRIDVVGFANTDHKRPNNSVEEGSTFNPVGPKGWTQPVPNWITLSKRLAPNCPFMSLVGQFKGGKPFCIGDNPVIPKEITQANLYMAVNDIFWDHNGNEMPNWFTENEGGFIVRYAP